MSELVDTPGLEHSLIDGACAAFGNTEISVHTVEGFTLTVLLI